MKSEVKQLELQNPVKRCPTCNRVENDGALAFCRVDGATLVNDSSSLGSEMGTARLGSGSVATETETNLLPNITNAGINRSTGPTTVLPNHSVGPTGQLKHGSRKRLVAIVVVVTAVIAATTAFFVNSYLAKKSKKTIQSIAVMPFVNDSGNSDVEYLSDGMTETLIGSLSQLPNVSVKARSSVFRYKGKETNSQTIGKELNVQAILNGRVVQRGDDLAVTLELVEAQTENVIWIGRYNRKQADLVTLQSEIARDVSSKLRTKLSGADEAKLTKTHTANPQAYQLYLKGQFYAAKRTKEDLLRSIESFEQAARLDSNFALAYVGIANSYGHMTGYGYAAPNEVFPKAIVLLRQALQIAPDLAEAHSSYGDILVEYDWNWLEAEREFKRALELNPNVAQTHYQYGTACLIPQGRFDEALTELRRGLELEPLSVHMTANLAGLYASARRNDLALEQAREALRLEPSHPTARFWMGFVSAVNGMYDEAISVCEPTLRSDPTNQDCLQVVGYAYAKAGRRREAEEVIRKFDEIGRTQYAVMYRPAVIHALLGDKEKAFAGLEKAFAAHDWDLQRINVDPFVDSLRDDPRFKDLTKRMGLTR